MKPRRTVFLMLLGVMSLSTMALGQGFDLVIANGRVMDPETGFDQIANVGINNGFITEISTEALEGAREIDATGHVVAPGFVDTHFHWQAPLGYMFRLRDGLTSSMDPIASRIERAA